MPFPFNKTGIFLLLAGALAIQACKDAEKKSDCPTTPEPIFSNKLETVEMHDFVRTGTEALEVVSFDNGVFLEIFQSGCDTLKQEFRFQLPGSQEWEQPEEWLDETRSQMIALGALGPDYLAFTEWAAALNERRETFRLAEPMELAAGFWMQIDKIESFDGVTLVVVLSDHEL